VQITSHVGHSMLGSNFSTSFKKVTFGDFCKYPGSVRHVMMKKRFVKLAMVSRAMIHSVEGKTTKVMRMWVTW
jgi:hypothetical protein